MDKPSVKKQATFQNFFFLLLYDDNNDDYNEEFMCSFRDSFATKGFMIIRP